LPGFGWPQPVQQAALARPTLPNTPHMTQRRCVIRTTCLFTCLSKTVEINLPYKYETCNIFIEFTSRDWFTKHVFFVHHERSVGS
jgi:hypothetical protein